MSDSINVDNGADAVQSLLIGNSGSTTKIEKSWDDFVKYQIQKLSSTYSGNNEEQTAVEKILADWHRQVTLGIKKDKNFSPHVNGFYMVHMVHGTWYESYKTYMNSPVHKTGSNDLEGTVNDIGLSERPDSGINFDNPKSYFGMMATDIDVPDITEEYISVSSRLRNSFVPSRNYFVSDFSITYIENTNLDIIRYHEAWHKYMNLIKRGEVSMPCEDKPQSYFLDMPFANAVWITVFKPFTTEIQLLIKLVGVMPVTMPLKQVVGNRSASKMTVLNLSYKAADIFYKFYNNLDEFMNDTGILAKSYKKEVLYGSE